MFVSKAGDRRDSTDTALLRTTNLLYKIILSSGALAERSYWLNWNSVVDGDSPDFIVFLNTDFFVTW